MSRTRAGHRMLLATGHASCGRDQNVVLWGAAGPCVGQQGPLSPASHVAQGGLHGGTFASALT